MNALVKYGFNSSSRFLSSKLNISYRTISSRLKSLREKRFLETYPLMNERRIGLGDCSIAIQESINCNSDQLYQFLEKIPYFYLISSTYGKYNGIYCYAIYDMNSPNPIKKFLEILESEELISDYYIFDILDQKICNPNFDYYDPQEGKWIWNWDQWEEKIITTLKHENLVNDSILKDLNFSYRPKVIDFDYIDVQLLTIIKEVQHSKRVLVTITELAERVGLSTYKVRNRIQNLTQQGVIKSFLTNFQLPDESDIYFIFFYIILIDSKYSSTFLTFICELPFQIDIFIGSELTFCLYYRTSAQEFSKFLRCFDSLKRIIKSYFLQIVPFFYSGRHHLFNAYNQNTHSWQTPIEDYISSIKDFKKELV